MEKYLTERRKSDCSENAKKCEINIETSYILQNCKIANNLKYLYVKHLCLDKFIELGGSTIDRTGLNYLIAYIDVAGILVLLITIGSVALISFYTSLVLLYSALTLSCLIFV